MRQRDREHRAAEHSATLQREHDRRAGEPGPSIGGRRSGPARQVAADQIEPELAPPVCPACGRPLELSIT
jgi:hypothetical protein